MSKEKYYERLAIFDEVIATCANLERKGKTMPYTSANGHMFSQLNKNAELGIRLSDEDRAAFGEKYAAEPFYSYGAQLRDYVLIPDELFDRPDELGIWLKKGWEHVLALPPK